MENVCMRVTNGTRIKRKWNETTTAKRISSHPFIHHFHKRMHARTHTHTYSMDYKMMIKLISTIIFALTWLHSFRHAIYPMFHPSLTPIYTLHSHSYAFMLTLHSLTPNAFAGSFVCLLARSIWTLKSFYRITWHCFVHFQKIIICNRRKDR